MRCPPQLPVTKLHHLHCAGRRIIRSNEMIEADATGADGESFASLVVAPLSQLLCGFIPEMND